MGVAAEDIRAQVGRLIQSKTFETSEVHRRLLQYLAEKSISGEADRLKEYTIGLEAFGKPPTYDPKHDSIVRLQAGRLRQKLVAYYQAEAAGDTETHQKFLGHYATFGDDRALTNMLLKNYRLSDDIAFRFGNRGWPEWPLTAEKFAGFLSLLVEP